MTYEAWRCTFQSSEQAARSAFAQVLALSDRIADLEAKAKAVIARWDSPQWKELVPTADYINELRKVVNQPGRVQETKNGD